MNNETGNAQTEQPKPSRRKWWQWLLMYPTLLASIIGAVPQYSNWWTAIQLKVPWKSVNDAEEQKSLWKKNFDCSWKKEAQAATTSVTTAGNDLVTLILCPTGDALVEFRKQGGPPTYRWVAFDKFSRGTALPMPANEAFAGQATRPEEMSAQAGVIVLCQKQDEKGFIVRLIQLPNGQCQEEVINPYTGAVVSVKPAPCKPC